jgi:uncharacterized membrane protein YbaN (DUF454 family)
MSNKLKQKLLFVAGTISLAIGVVGIFVPLLPTTPFLLLAATCYLRSSERFYRWLLNNRFFGTYISNYIEGKGVPLRIKIYTIALLWTTISLSIFLISPSIVVKIALVIVAVGVTLHIILLRRGVKRNKNRGSNNSLDGDAGRSGQIQ